jgi:uncharacterized membrane-anchored protein
LVVFVFRRIIKLVIQEQPVTVTIVQLDQGARSAEVSMIDVAVAAFGLTGVIMAAALVAGLAAGAVFIWYRSKRAVSIIEERGHQHNLFRA